MIRALLVMSALCGAAPAARAEVRWALVVGVGHYAALPFLPNPVSDARAVANALHSAGYQVTALYDPTGAQLRAAFAGAEAATKGASVALLYFAGHAVDFRNRNVLLGADADLRDEDGLRQQGVSLTDFTRRTAGAVRRLLLVDACRTPLSFPVLGGEHGHAQEAPGGQTVFEFSAGPEQAASDGEADHSPFAQALLRGMGTPGLELNPLLVQVGRYVDTHATDQQPVSYGRFSDDFFIVPTPAQAARMATAAPPGSTSVDMLLARLEPASGVKRLYGLQDALRAAPVQRGLDASQALAILGDIPAPVLRRHALLLLLPSLVAPLSEPESARLLASFDESARAQAIELLRPCMALPLAGADLDDVLGNVRPPERAVLAQELARPATAGACPAIRS